MIFTLGLIVCLSGCQFIAELKKALINKTNSKSDFLVEMTVEEFLEALKISSKEIDLSIVEAITYDTTKEPGVTLREDERTAKVYGVKLIGEFNTSNVTDITGIFHSSGTVAVPLEITYSTGWTLGTSSTLEHAKNLKFTKK